VNQSGKERSSINQSLLIKPCDPLKPNTELESAGYSLMTFAQLRGKS